VKVVTGKSILQILKENEIETPLPEDLTNLAKKAIVLRKHLESNHKDLDSKKGLQRTESKIYRLIKYYKKKKVLPSEFKYDPEKIRTIVMR
jgi:small subunit ribosomal protein S15